MSTRYETVIFLQGDDYLEAEETADEATASSVGEVDPWWPGLYRGCAEWTRALFDHLMQWEYGEGTDDESTEPPWGSSDDTAYFTKSGRHYTGKGTLRNGYAVSYNTGLSYAGLTRVTTRKEDTP